MATLLSFNSLPETFLLENINLSHISPSLAEALLGGPSQFSSGLGMANKWTQCLVAQVLWSPGG